MLIRAATSIVRNQQYVSRSKDEKSIDELLATGLKPKGIVVISGEAKTGKTELATEYYFAKANEYDYSFWLRGDSREELLQDLKVIIEEIDEKKEKKGFLFDLKSLLNDTKDLPVLLKRLKKVFERSNKKWLLLVDNVCFPEIERDLPATIKENQHIIITTKYSSLLKIPSLITLKEFSETECQSLFAKWLNQALTAQDKTNIDNLFKRFDKDLDMLVMASRIYAQPKKQKKLLEICADANLELVQIRQRLLLLEITSDQTLLNKLGKLNFFKTSFVSKEVLASFIAFTPEQIQLLLSHKVITESEDKTQLALAPSYQWLIQDFGFKEYDDHYKSLLEAINKSFAWTRTYYNKNESMKKDETFKKQQNHMEELALKLLDGFLQWQKLANANYSIETVLPVVKLNNSVGRYAFIREWFVQAFDNYQAAKTKFDLLLTDTQRTYFESNRTDSSNNKKWFGDILKELGVQACWIYAQEVLHNIGATIVKITWDSTEKAEKLKQATKYLQLAFDWQSYLIKNFKYDDKELVSFIKQQLGLDNKKTLTEDELKGQLYHFANFTKQILAQAYMQQKDLPKALEFYQKLILDPHYMDRAETKPLAYRNLANLLHRQSKLLEKESDKKIKLEEALGNINKAYESAMLLEKHPTASGHYRGLKEQVLYERAKIYLYQYAQDKRKVDLLNKAKTDLEEIIQLNSVSSLYKAKAHYQLLKIAETINNKIDQLNNLEKAIAAVKDRNILKQESYEKLREKYLKESALNFSEQHKATLKKFNIEFELKFLKTLKTTIDENDKVTDKIELFFGLFGSILKLVPKATVGIPSGATADIENPLPQVVNDLATSIVKYRKSRSQADAVHLEAVKLEVQNNARGLAELISKQYAYQIRWLTNDDLKNIINKASELLVDFMKAGKVLTKVDGSDMSIEEQLLKILIDKMPKIKLTTTHPEIYQRWNTAGLFKKPAYLIKTADGSQELYAREEAKTDKHHKYGYSMLDTKPVPEWYFRKYNSEADLEKEKADANPSRPGCSVM